jgi:hypothetical protein
MIKKFVLCAAALAFVFSLTIAGGTCFASDPGPAEMTLKAEKGNKPVKFGHKAHQDMYACGDCHHAKGADGKQAPLAEGAAVEKCATCHNADIADPKLNSFKGAAHANCKGCHKDAAKEGKAAPTKCAGCHPKKKK